MKPKKISYYIGLTLSSLANLFFLYQLAYYAFLPKDQSFYSGVGDDFDLIILGIYLLPIFIITFLLCIFEILDNKEIRTSWKLQALLAPYLINFILFIIYKIVFNG